MKTTTNFTPNTSLTEMIEAGNYVWFPRVITGQIKTNEPTEVSMPHLFEFETDMDSKTAVIELEKLGLRPATLPELLLFGANNPDEQRMRQIVALDPEWVFCPTIRITDSYSETSRKIPILDNDDGDRIMSFSEWDNNHSCFAVVKK